MTPASLLPRSQRPRNFTQADDFTNKKSHRRSNSYTTPLDFDNNREAIRTNPRLSLTHQNLELLSQSFVTRLAEQDGSDPTFSGTFMRNKSNKKKTKNVEHPLNLPPDQLKRLSQRMAREEEQTSVKSMDVDMSDTTSETQADAGSTSEPQTPGTNPPGAFPETNGDAKEDTKSPAPPPHRVNTQPKTDPDAAKAAGNKFFKAKDYTRAVAEYSKGKLCDQNVVCADSL